MVQFKRILLLSLALSLGLAACRPAASTGVQTDSAAPRASTTADSSLLGAAEQAQYAGQMLRFLPLVALEYGRGVVGDVVTGTAEVHEAAEFHGAARDAFIALRDELNARSPKATQAIQTQFDLIDAQLVAAVQGSRVVDAETVNAEIDMLLDTLHAAMPAAWQPQNDGGFTVITAALDRMSDAANSGDMVAAERARLEAYALLESGPEARLLAFAPEIVARLEGLFWYGVDGVPGIAALIAQGAPADQIHAAAENLGAELDKAQTVLSGTANPMAVSLNAAVIVFREGLEAVVILAALLASMVGARRGLRRPMVLGVVLALFASALTWWLMQSFLSAFRGYGERLEAVVSLVAIAMLLVVTNWFFYRVYWTEWMAGLHTRKKELIGGVVVGQSLGFVLLGFSSVYREGFETALFMQALVLDGGVWPTLRGATLGLVGVLGLGWVTFRLQSRLPYKKILYWTGVLLSAVLLVMVGHTVHVLQLVGWMPLHSIAWLALPYWTGIWFGVYATWEGLVLQTLAAAFVIGSYYLAEATQRGPRVKTEPTARAVAAQPVGSRSHMHAPLENVASEEALHSNPQEAPKHGYCDTLWQ